MKRANAWRNAVLDMRENTAISTEPMVTKEEFDAIVALTDDEFERHIQQHVRRPPSRRRQRG